MSGKCLNCGQALTTSDTPAECQKCVRSRPSQTCPKHEHSDCVMMVAVPTSGADFGLMVHLGGDRVRCVATMLDKAMADRFAWLWNHAPDVQRKSVAPPPPPPPNVHWLTGKPFG